MTLIDSLVFNSSPYRELAAKLWGLEERHADLVARHAALLVYVAHLGSSPERAPLTAALTKLGLHVFVVSGDGEPFAAQTAERVIDQISEIRTLPRTN